MKKLRLSAAVPFFLAVMMLLSLCLPSFAESTAVEKEDRTVISGEQVKDGVYDIDVESSSSMFRVVKAVLTVKNGEMSAVLTLSGTGYGKLFMGTAEEAASAESSDFIPFAEDSSGAYTYEVPVEALNQEVKCAAWSTKKEKWYDRDLVFLSDGIPAENISIQGSAADSALSDYPDGVYRVDVILSGGGGKASVKSPAELRIEGGNATAEIEWSSPNYDYMIVDGVRFTPVNTDGNSVFEIPVNVLDEEFSVIADTTAMGTPHEIEYTLKIDSSGITQNMEQEKNDGENKDTKGEKVPAAMIAVVAVLVLAALIAGAAVGRKIAKKRNSR